ncbi:MAG: LptF/LptG family permease [Proteobacteria bacterium]|nr:LptF/LptG family permease [Pseudomonadota bacterium]
MVKRYHQYIFFEMLPPFIVSILVFTFMFLVVDLVKLTEMVVKNPGCLGQVLALMLCSLPFFMVFVLPMATLLGVLLGIIRLSSDNELTALKSSGVSLWQILPPVLALSLMTLIVSGVLSIWLKPLGLRAAEDLRVEIGTANPELALKPDVINIVNRHLVIYVGQAADGGRFMRHLLIWDERNPRLKQTIVAKRGSLRLVPGTTSQTTIKKIEKKFMLVLRDAKILKVSPDLRVTPDSTFEGMRQPLILSQLIPSLQGGRRHPGGMTLGELLAALEKAPPGTQWHNRLLINLHQLFSIPMACLIMGLLGVPLGIQGRGSSRFAGVIISFIIFVVYYLFMNSAFTLGKDGTLPPVLGVWLGNIVFGLLATYMVWEASRDRPILFIRIFYAAGFRVQRTLRKLGLVT